jgi:hypothetical protein
MGGETLGVNDGLHSFEDLLWFEYDTPNTRVPDTDTDTGIDTVRSVLIPHVITCTRTNILASTQYHLDTSAKNSSAITSETGDDGDDGDLRSNCQ